MVLRRFPIQLSTVQITYLDSSSTPQSKDVLLVGHHYPRKMSDYSVFPPDGFDLSNYTSQADNIIFRGGDLIFVDSYSPIINGGRFEYDKETYLGFYSSDILSSSISVLHFSSPSIVSSSGYNVAIASIVDSSAVVSSFSSFQIPQGYMAIPYLKSTSEIFLMNARLKISHSNVDLGFAIIREDVGFPGVIYAEEPITIETTTEVVGGGTGYIIEMLLFGVRGLYLTGKTSTASPW